MRIGYFALLHLEKGVNLKKYLLKACMDLEGGGGGLKSEPQPSKLFELIN